MQRRPDLVSRAACKNGHPFTGENLHMRGTIRVCRTCRAASKERRRRRNGGLPQAQRRELSKHHKQLSIVLYPTRAKGESKRDAAARKRARNQALVDELKSDPCVDCGVSYPSYVMDFDHLPGFEKRANVSTLASGAKSRALIMAEIAKCELVCSNCHRIRTHARRGKSHATR